MCSLMQTMSELRNATEASGLIHHAFAENVYQDDTSYPVYRYFISHQSDR